MNLKIKIAVTLVVGLLLTVTGLQFLYNYNLYRTETTVFTRTADESLKEAIQLSRDQKRQTMLRNLKCYLENPKYFKIIVEKQEPLKFSLIERSPKIKNHDRLTMSFQNLNLDNEDLKGKEKDIFIPRFLKNVDDDLKEYYTWYYTPLVGDFIDNQFEINVITLNKVQENYLNILKQKGINEFFVFNKPNRGEVTTHTYEVEPRVKNIMNVYAAFPNPMKYFLRQQIWTILGSFLLVCVVLISSVYLTKLLLSQERLGKEKDQLMQHLSHELRTPVSSIQIAAEGMRDHLQGERERREYINIILDKTKELSSFTHDVLNELSLNKTRFFVEEYDLSDILIRLKNRFENERVVIDVIEINPVKIFINVKHFENALNNLIENAIKYNKNETPRIIIRSRNIKKAIEITLEDNGEGIEDQYKKKVFKRFFRVPKESGYIYETKGFGIGLSYVKYVIELHKASIEILDADPQGTIFKIILPYAKA